MTLERTFAEEVRAAFLRYRDQVDIDEIESRRVRSQTGVLIGLLAEIEFYRDERVDA